MIKKTQVDKGSHATEKRNRTRKVLKLN